MESYKDWLNTRISIWQEHAAINEQDNIKNGIKTYVNAYHNALVEYEKMEKAGLVGVSK